ncbi:MAG TPA: hypothetical protein VGG19_18995 [Tepidisphaeraceae bacterium]|jgi:flavin-dependent dehydrogenase
MSASAELAHVDILVIGSHPCSYLAAALLRDEPALSVMHVNSNTRPQRKLATLNPAFFALHPSLKPLEEKLKLRAMHGLKFLADDFSVFCQHCDQNTMTYVCEIAELVDAAKELARAQGVQLIENASVQIHHLDESGISVAIDGASIYPSALILSEPLDARHQQMLGLSEDWEHDVLYRFSLATIPAPPTVDGPQLIRMSLDLSGSLAWGWLLVHDDQAEIVVGQPVSTINDHPSEKLLKHWLKVLQGHKELASEIALEDAHISTFDLPLAGALAQEGIGNRTILIGPAGGFYSACGEDLYPNCWSAFFATKVIRQALREKHLQDAINHYRTVWRTTLGDYLRGPQQNLRFLLPLMYRNQTMTTRLAESILLGKQVVR